MLTLTDRFFISSLVERVLYKAAADESAKTLTWAQSVIPALLAGGAGAAYGAYQSPGGSPTRGAIVGGLAGVGAGGAFTGVHQALSSPHGAHMNGSPAVNAGLQLGAAGVGGYAGLQAGRKLSDKLGLPDTNKDDELDELNLLQKGRKYLPSEIGGYFGIKSK